MDGDLWPGCRERLAAWRHLVHLGMEITAEAFELAHIYADASIMGQMLGQKTTA